MSSMDIENNKEVSNKNYKLNQSEKFINKWFNDTISRFETEIKSQSGAKYRTLPSLNDPIRV